MLSLDHITMQFGGRVLFEDVSLMIAPHDRIGLVGSNGAGKSTLLKIIAGLIEPESGEVHKAGFVTVGYLPQDGIVASGSTLYREVETSFESVHEVQNELEQVMALLSSLPADSAEHAEAIELYGELQHKLEELDAFRMKSKIETVLMGLGFSVGDFERQTEEFSGGWQMRIALAKLLLKQPSVLLLDEPTNHLDLPSLQWLESYLQEYQGAIAIVSHDRQLLDNLTKKTLAISRGEAESYPGNYSYFVASSALRREQQINARKNQEKQLKHHQRFIDRFRSKASKASQVQSRIKAMEKIDIIDVEEDEEEIHFHFPKAPASGVRVMELRNMTKRYGGLSVFENLDFVIDRGERIAIVGVNGAGKSTFSRLIAGVEAPTSGARVPGHNVTISYFAQHQAEELDQKKEVLEILSDVAVGEIRTKLRTLLGAFLFHGDDVFKKVKVLSGGEKSRLALAKMLLQPANVLVMDEPTNHLDMKSKSILQRAIGEYEGTIIVVSHDRAFLDPLVTKTIEISRHGVKSYLGNVSHYIGKKREEEARTAEAPPGAEQKSAMPEKERKRREAELRQQSSAVLRPLKEKLKRVEEEIASFERRKGEIDLSLSDPELYKNGEEVKKLHHELKSIGTSLTDAYYRWDRTSRDIEEEEQRASRLRDAL